jgi:hypothetical protein
LARARAFWQEWVIAVRSWWFTIGFVGVGLTTHFKTMVKKLKGGHAVSLYCMGQLFDLLLTSVYHACFFVFLVIVFWEGKIPQNISRHPPFSDSHLCVCVCITLRLTSFRGERHFVQLLVVYGCRPVKPPFIAASVGSLYAFDLLLL